MKASKVKHATSLRYWDFGTTICGRAEPVPVSFGEADERAANAAGCRLALARASEANPTLSVRQAAAALWSAAVECVGEEDADGQNAAEKVHGRLMTAAWYYDGAHGYGHYAEAARSVLDDIDAVMPLIPAGSARHVLASVVREMVATEERMASAETEGEHGPEVAAEARREGSNIFGNG